MAAATGNRCGHDPRRPRLKLCRADDETRGKPFPWLIQQLLNRLERLYRDRDLFPELGPRKRSERIEAMVLVGKAAARNFDILTGRCGRPRADGSFTGISMETIAKWTGLAVQRAYRALWDLRDAGWMTSSQPIEKRHAGKCSGRCPRGSHRGHAAIRTIKPALFERLGLRGRLKAERRERSDAARTSTPSQTIAQRRQLRRLFRASPRAATLTRRTTEQLAGAAAPPPPARQEALADMAARLAAWRARQSD